MAAKRKTAKKGRRKSTTKRRSPVTSLRRGAVYVTNPRRRRNPRRRHYARNPGIVKTVIQTGKDTAAVLVGAAAGRTIGNMLPSIGGPIGDAAKGVLVAIGVRMIATRFLGGDFARFAAAGAMQVPFKNLVTGFVPGAAAFLGSYDEPMSLQSYSEVAGYQDAEGAEEIEVGSYGF
jgi:hypothetical protein